MIKKMNELDFEGNVRNTPHKLPWVTIPQSLFLLEDPRERFEGRQIFCCKANYKQICVTSQLEIIERDSTLVSVSPEKLIRVEGNLYVGIWRSYANVFELWFNPVNEKLEIDIQRIPNLSITTRLYKIEEGKLQFCMQEFQSRKLVVFEIK